MLAVVEGVLEGAGVHMDWGQQVGLEGVARIYLHFS